MNNYNPIIVAKAKKYIDETFDLKIKRDFYNDVDDLGNVKVLVRDDARKIEEDWVAGMDSFIGKVLPVIYVDYDDLFGGLALEVENDQDTYFFVYKSLIPIKLLDKIKSELYQPKKFVYESENLEMITEMKNYYNTQSQVDYDINNFDIKPLPNFKIGDICKIKPNGVGIYIEKSDDENVFVDYNGGTEMFIKENINKEVEILDKFKGGMNENYPWWSKILSPGGNSNYVPDFVFNSSTPNYSKREFIYESADLILIDGYNLNHRDNDAIPFVINDDFVSDIGENSTKHSEMWQDEAKADFREDYHINPEEFEEQMGRKPSDPITIKEIEEYYDGEADFDEYFQDMFEDDIYSEAMEFAYIGRLWSDSKIISFWKYPENIVDMKKAVESLEKESGIKIWNDGWKILVLMIKDVKDTKGLVYSREEGVENKKGEWYKHKEKLIPLESYTQSLNPSEEEMINHIKSPIEKEKDKQEDKKKGIKKELPSIGSSKSIPGALPGEVPVETKHRLHKESVNMLELYRKNMKKSGFNTLILNKAMTDTDEKSKLVEYLISMNIDRTDVISKWYVSDESCVLITLDDITESNNLKPNMCYTSTTRYIESGELVSEFPTIKPTPIMDLTEMINFVETKIINQGPSYDKKEFIYEAYAHGQKIKDYYLNVRDYEYNTIILEGLPDTYLSQLGEINELKRILNQLLFEMVDEAFDAMVSINNAHDNHILIILDNYDKIERDLVNVKQNRIYTCNDDMVNKLDGIRIQLPNSKYIKFTDVGEVVKLFKKFIFNSTGLYRPRKFVYENNDNLGLKYRKKLNDLNINTLLLTYEKYDEKEKNELMNFLEMIGVTGLLPVVEWDTVKPEMTMVITLDIDDSHLSKYHAYKSTTEYIRDNFIHEDSQYTTPGIKNIFELNSYIDSNVINIASGMYKPRKFIYENNIKKLDNF